MKRQCLVVLATVAAMIIGLGSLASVQGSDEVMSVPGIMILEDLQGDLQLRNCNTTLPGIACSLPVDASGDLPGYFDIKSARITQIGKGMVDLVIKVYEPIPEAPPYGFVAYIWQFQGGCLLGYPPQGDKYSISIVWKEGVWEANWYVITDCDPRTITKLNSVPFEFIVDGVKIRVAWNDLRLALDSDGQLTWHAAVRRLPFIYAPDGQGFPNTTGVDYAPDVAALPPCPECYSQPEDPAIWEPR
jgi:hypothetical protein